MAQPELDNPPRHVDAVAIDLDAINAEYADAAPEALIEWAADTFGDRFAMTSSFGMQSAVMLHLVTRIVPDIPVVFIDTGYLFPETYRFADELRDRLKLNLKVYQSPISPARMEALHGKLWEDGDTGHARYNLMRKVEPMRQAVEQLGIVAWAAGLRADQTDYRATLRRIDKQDGAIKVHPILNWSSRDVGMYLTQHDLPYHPLVEKGYLSIGDTHSTRPISEMEGERAGRFGGLRQECGLHIPQTQQEQQSLDSAGL